MVKNSPALGASALMILVLALFSQRSTAQAYPVGRAPRATQPPCWEEAGISKSAMQERRAIQQRTRSERDAVCADTSLTPQERQQKLKQIHEQEKQQLDALISPQQMEALRSCQMSRNHGGAHPGGGHPPMAGRGPCGELPGKTGPKPPNPAPGTNPESENEN